MPGAGCRLPIQRTDIVFHILQGNTVDPMQVSVDGLFHDREFLGSLHVTAQHSVFHPAVALNEVRPLNRAVGLFLGQQLVYPHFRNRRSGPSAKKLFALFDAQYGNSGEIGHGFPPFLLK